LKKKIQEEDSREKYIENPNVITRYYFLGGGGESRTKKKPGKPRKKMGFRKT